MGLNYRSDRTEQKAANLLLHGKWQFFNYAIDNSRYP